MQVLVLYYSKSGNTKRLAEHVASGVEKAGLKAVLRSTEEVKQEDFLEASGIVAGSPVYFGVMAWQLKKVFDEFVSVRRKMENKVGAVFASGGHHSGGKETTMFSIIQCMMIYGMLIAGDPMSASGHYGVASLGPPDLDAAGDAEKLGTRVAELCRKMG